MERRNPARWWFFAVGCAAAACFVGSWFLPWWTFRLFAPQYPAGLEVIVHLTGVVGDVAEINTINHYIGMHSLSDAAALERAASPWLIGLVSAVVVGAAALPGRKRNWFALAAAAGLPVGFVLDFSYWMYQSGHDLDPRAPIRLKPFMPAVLGDGKVGQFLTEAAPAAGFWLALFGVAILAIATWRWTSRLGVVVAPAEVVQPALLRRGA